VTNPKDDMARIEDTKGGLVRQSYVWILQHKDFIDWRTKSENRLLWIKGDPGKGKTMLLIAIVRELQQSQSGLLSYFFCQETDSTLNNAVAILRGLIYQLIEQKPSLISHLRTRYEREKQLFEGNNVIYTLQDIFIKMLQDLHLTTIYLVADALDECTSELSTFLRIIVENTSSLSSRVKWLVASRNRPDIENKLGINDGKFRLSLELNAESVSEAVDAYITDKVTTLAKMKNYDAKLEKHMKEELHRKANGTFLWVALVCKDLERVSKWDARKSLELFPPGLTPLYARMIHEMVASQNGDVCIELLSITTLAFRPLSLLELALLAGLPEGLACNQKDVEDMCGSFLTVREGSVYFIHQSAKDFLAAHRSLFPTGQADVHCRIVSRSLQAMNEKLHRDIYKQRHPGISIAEINIGYADPLAQIRYSCVNWVDHVCANDRGSHDSLLLRDNGEIHTFLNSHFLHWLEALSLMRHMSSGVTMIRKLGNLLARYIDTSQLLDLVRDELRFILRNRWVIENAPLQVYASALIFSPVRSLTRLQWKEDEPEWIITKPIVEDNWSPCLETLEGHGASVASVVYSRDSRQLASASEDRTVKIWDAETGKCVQTLEGHRGWVNAVVFSHDSRQLATASDDHTVKIWDAETGKCVQTLEGHRRSVNSVVFSHDSRQLASASYDHTVKIWDAEKGKCVQTLEGHRGGVNAVVFSHDSRQLC